MLVRAAHGRRAGALLVGLLFGVLFVGLIFWFYGQAARAGALRTVLQQELELPREAFELERLAAGRMRIAARGLALLDSAGDTIVAAPFARFWLDPDALAGDGPIVLTDVELRQPYLRLVQLPAGEWNVQQAARMMVAGEEVAAADDGRAIVLRRVRVTGGRALLATLWSPDGIAPAAQEDLRIVNLAGTPYRIRTVHALDGALPEVRFGGPLGWRAEVADLSATLRDPDLRLARLRGVVEDAPDGIRFDIRELRTDRSLVAGTGRFRTGPAGPVVDARLTASPLDFRDLRWISDAVPAEGEARFALGATTRADGRTVWAVRDLDVVTLDSRAHGRLTVVTGADLPPTFRDTELELDPLDLRLLESVGFVDRVPYVGEIRGRVTTLAEIEDAEGPLALDLVATVTPRDLPDVAASTLAAQGAVVVGGDAGLSVQNLRLGLRPLQLAALGQLLPEQQQQLQGTLRGAVLVTGNADHLVIDSGELTYEVAAAAPTRLTAVSGFVTRAPDLRYELSAHAQPLSLGTVAELVPAFPFRETMLSGPIEIAGTGELVNFHVVMRGDVGAFTAAGTYAFEEPGRFRLGGRLDALRPARLLRQEVPLAGPVSGPFLVEGTTEDFRFDVDFTQAAGRFALAGRVQRPLDLPPRVEAAGEVSEFRVGTLIGRTGLFASPLTGAVAVAGGGGAAYTFDLDLRGPGATLDVEGWYHTEGVPSYAFSGSIAGLDLRLVPGLEAFPHTNLVAGLAVDARGTTLETFDGRFALDATGSTVGGLPVQTAVGRGAVEGGVLRLDTARVAILGTRLDAGGAWGLTLPTAEPLRFSVSSPNLAQLTPVLVAMRHVEPQLTGSLTVQGSVAGTIEHPIIDASARGRRLRFDGWRAGSLVLDVDVARTEAGWSGETSLLADNAVLSDLEALETLRVEAVGTPDSVAFGLLARRDRSTEAAVSGTLELEGETPQGVSLQSLALRLDGSDWRLQQPSAVRWGEIRGIEVDSLVLLRTGDEAGRIEVDGRLPPTGTLDFSVRAENVDIGEFRRIVRTAPEVEGVLTMDARLEGPGTTPELTLGARLTGFRYGDAAADAIALNLNYADTRADAAITLWQNGIEVATGEAVIPLQLVLEDLEPQVELLDEAPVSARIAVDSLSLGLLSAAFPQISDGIGAIAGEFTVGGLLGAPQLQGWATLANGALTVDALGVRYQDVNGRLNMTGQNILIESLTARSGGAAAISGAIQLDDRSRPQLDLRGTLNQFRAIDRADVASIAVSGQLALTGRYPTPTLSGRAELTAGSLTLPQLEDRQIFEIADIDVGDVADAPLPTAALEPTFVEQVRIAGLEVFVGEGVWAVAPEARVQIGGDLIVSRFGPDDWQVFGDLLVRRGSYTLTMGPLIREFDVVSGRIEFFGTPDLNPALDILAQHRVRATGAGAAATLNILVNVTGSVQFPRVTLTTDTQPPLPESEILSYLIFGRPTFALGEVGGGLAQQLLVQEFAGGLLAAQVEQLIQQAGLPFDYIRVRGRPAPSEFVMDPLGTTTIEVGWEIARDLFWTVEWGVGLLFGGQIGDTWGTSLEWEIDPQWSTRLAWEPLRRDPLLRPLTTEVVRQFTLDLRRRWEYGVTPPPLQQPGFADERLAEPPPAEPGETEISPGAPEP